MKSADPKHPRYLPLNSTVVHQYTHFRLDSLARMFTPVSPKSVITAFPPGNI